MKLELFTLIPAFALGWALASSVPQEDNSSPASAQPKQEKPASARSSSLALNGTNQIVPKSSDQCQTTLADLKNETDLHPLIRRALVDQTLRAWLEVDPAAALAFAESQARHNYEASLDKDLFRVWVDLDADGAKQAFSVASPALIASCFYNFFIDLGKRNPEDTLDFMESRQWFPKEKATFRFRHEEIINTIYSAWGTRDPQAALLRAGSNQKAVQAAYTGWAKIEPLSAWEAATNGGTNIQGNPNAEAIAHLVLPIKPEVFMAFTKEETNQNRNTPFLLESKLRDIATKWVKFDLDGARRFLSEENNLEITALKTQIAHSIATADPEGAIALFQETGGASTSSYRNHGIFRQAFLSLNSSDPARARELLQEIPAQHRHIALSGILTHEFARDPKQAMAQAQQFLNDPSTKEHLIPALGHALSWGHGSGNHDLTEVVDAIPELRPKVKGYLLEGWVRSAPEAAASFLAEEAHQHADQGLSFPQKNEDVPPGNIVLQNDELGRSIAELSFSRPEFTSEWVSTLPPGDFQNNVAASLATNWARFDRESAQAWIESLPEGPMKTQAETMLAKPIEDSVFER